MKIVPVNRTLPSRPEEIRPLTMQIGGALHWTSTVFLTIVWCSLPAIGRATSVA
jgi:hypothetical protein